MRNKYHINISSGAITQNNTDQNAFHTIYANDEEIREIRSELEKMQEASLGSFVRAHIPIMPYHNDRHSDSYDASLYELYHLLYELGDEETKEHIMSLDILSL